MNLFTEIAKGIKWVGKELSKVSEWIPKLVTLVDDVEEDATTAFPELVTVVEDVEALVIAGVKDSGSGIAALQNLVTTVTLAVGQEGLNVASDTAVVAAFETFISTVKSGSTWTDVLKAYAKLVTDYDTLKGTALAEIQKLESDAKG